MFIIKIVLVVLIDVIEEEELKNRLIISSLNLLKSSHSPKNCATFHFLSSLHVIIK